MVKTSYAEFRQIVAQVNDCALAFLGSEKYDISVSVINFSYDDEISTGVSVFVHYMNEENEDSIVMHLNFANYISAEENYAELQKLWDFVGENTEG